MRLINLFVALAPLTFVASCTSMEHIASDKREDLLKIYPLETTSRTDVAEKQYPIEPELSRARPDEGWGVAKEPFIANRLPTIEANTGNTVAVFDRYYAPDDLFALCRVWYFFDENNKLIDLEWNYVND